MSKLENYLVEARFKSRYIGKANDFMAQFLNEIEDKIEELREDPATEGKAEDFLGDFMDIDNTWESLWQDIVRLVKKLGK